MKSSWRPKDSDLPAPKAVWRLQHGDHTVVIDPDSRNLVLRSTEEGAIEAFLCLVDLIGPTYVLFSADLAPFNIERALYVHHIVSLACSEDAENPARIRLASAHGEGVLVAPDVSDGAAPGRIACDHDDGRASDFERFPVAAPAAGATVALQMLRMRQLLDPGLDIAAAETRDAITLADGLWRTLPKAYLAALAERLMQSPRLRRAFADIIPGDLWLTYSLPLLAEWFPGQRQTPRRMELGIDLDALELLHVHYPNLPLGLACASATRLKIAPWRSVCAIATARNEGLYLLDWVAYHRSIGIEHLFVYTNDNDDGSDDLLAALARAGFITWINNRVSDGVTPQYKAYGHALNSLPATLDFAWTLVIDLDEFFGFDTDRFKNIIDYIEWHDRQPVDAVALNWVMFYGPGVLRWGDAPVWDRFVMRRAAADSHIKCLFRTNTAWQSHAHFPRASLERPLVFRDAEGGDISDRPWPYLNDEARTDAAWVAHYHFRSAAEYVWKKQRDTGDQPRSLRKGARFTRSEALWFEAQFGSADCVRDERMVRCASRADIFRATMLANPEIRDAEEAIKAIFRSRFGPLVGEAADAERARADANPALLHALDRLIREGGDDRQQSAQSKEHRLAAP